MFSVRWSSQQPGPFFDPLSSRASFDVSNLANPSLGGFFDIMSSLPSGFTTGWQQVPGGEPNYLQDLQDFTSSTVTSDRDDRTVKKAVSRLFDKLIDKLDQEDAPRVSRRKRRDDDEDVKTVRSKQRCRETDNSDDIENNDELEGIEDTEETDDAETVEDDEDIETIEGEEVGDDDEADGDDWVESCYKDFLGRKSDASGKTFWEGVCKGTDGKKAVIRGIVCGKEYGDRNVDDKTFVRDCYKHALGRDADEGGLNFWFEEIRSGRKTRSQVAAAICESEEFQKRSI